MLRPGKALILIVITLLVCAVVMVSSAGLSVGGASVLTIESVFKGRSATYALIAIIALIIGSFVPTLDLYRARGFDSIIPWLLLSMLGLLVLVLVPGIGSNINGARRWFNLGGISFQPSEYAKWTILILLAWWCTRRAGAMHRFWAGFLPPLLVIGAVCALIALEDLGTAVLIGLVGVILLVTAGARLRHAALVVPIGAAGFVAAVMQSPYRMQRLLAYVDPFQDADGIGYHVIQSMSAVSGGGLVGRGLGNGIRKFGYLPEDTTDFIFAVICEEIGVFGAAFVLFLYTMLLVYSLSIIKSAVHPFQRLLGTGVVLTIGLQALINIAVVTGVAPTKGIALPLLSSGGTGWVLTAFSIGLLVSMERDQLRALAGRARTDPAEDAACESEQAATPSIGPDPPRPLRA